MHTLYRMYDRSDVLLYVGITSTALGVRFAQHEQGSAWLEDVVSIKIEHFESRAALEDAEKIAIETECPKFNRTGDHGNWRVRFNPKRLTKIRRAVGMTQTELSNRTGLAVSLVQRYEQGRVQPPVEKLAIIAEALGAPVDAFIGTGNGWTPDRPEPDAISRHTNGEPYFIVPGISCQECGKRRLWQKPRTSKWLCENDHLVRDMTARRRKRKEPVA